MNDPQRLYEQDFYAWTAQTAALLRAGRVEDLDLEHLALEVADMGRQQRNALRSQLRQALVHLLKLGHSPAQDPRRGWFEEVQNARAEIADLLADNPSLRPLLPALLTDAWPRARRQTEAALAAFGEPVTLPETCPYTLAQVQDADFWP